MSPGSASRAGCGTNFDPQLHTLTSPTGPFAQCNDERHHPAKPLRTNQPLNRYFYEI